MSLYDEFLCRYDYDIRKSGDARWIDQKCTYDVVSIIADCINEYLENSDVEEFTVSDIWHSDYARENVISIFSKPDPGLKASNEYDKFFGQPIKLLGYSRILNVRKESSRYFYSINNRELLESVALRPTNALNFLYEYIIKVLADSGLSSAFDSFFEEQTKDSYKSVRDTFINFTIRYTQINGEVECGRIFTKVINPIAFKLKKLGTEKGRISKFPITLADLQYNRSNWRDELSGKEKSLTRFEHEPSYKQKQSEAMATYVVNKAKKAVRKFNDFLYGGKSEVYQETEIVKATQTHHIFAQAEFPTIADYVENLIMLTPNQHYSMAHPDNSTQYIDKDFQYICLLAKTTKIFEDLTSDRKTKFYNFGDYIFVLDTGLQTNEFELIEEMDFSTLIEKIDLFYCNHISDNNYGFLIEQNRLQLPI